MGTVRRLPTRARRVDPWTVAGVDAALRSMARMRPLVCPCGAVEGEAACDVGVTSERYDGDTGGDVVVRCETCAALEGDTVSLLGASSDYDAEPSPRGCMGPVRALPSTGPSSARSVARSPGDASAADSRAVSLFPSRTSPRPPTLPRKSRRDGT